jgi:hypothetical protein
MVHPLSEFKINSKLSNSDKAPSRFDAPEVTFSQKAFQFFDGWPIAIVCQRIWRGAIDNDPDKKSDCHIGQGCHAGKFS